MNIMTNSPNELEGLSPTEQQIARIVIRGRFNPKCFIQDMWGLSPERDNNKFIKGKNLSRQQDDFFTAIEKAIRGTGKRRISVKSGHGVGKTTNLSMLILWYLFCNQDAQVPCTAPTTDQMHDILWKELALWLGRMPKPFRDCYEWTTDHIRMRQRPETWFARARTARKDAPEALAGVHGNYVLFVIDEASGVPEEIFRTAEGSLTGKNVLVVMMSNPTRLQGYFYDSHHTDASNWQLLTFSSVDSPLVEKDYIERIADKHGEGSDEYKIRVLGEFPSEESVDDQGYVPLFNKEDLKFCEPFKFIGIPILGIDPAGEGEDQAVWITRDNFKAQISAMEGKSTPHSGSNCTLSLMFAQSIDENNVYIDNFGPGAYWIQEIAKDRKLIKGINVGDKCEDSLDDEMFLNKRARNFWRMREWILKGGQLVGDYDKWKELLVLKFKRTLSGKIQIISKHELSKQGIKSPNKCDALMLTFEELYPFSKEMNKEQERVNTLDETFNPSSVI